MSKQSQENFFNDFVEKLQSLKREKTTLKNELDKLILVSKNSKYEKEAVFYAQQKIDIVKREIVDVSKDKEIVI